MARGHVTREADAKSRKLIRQFIRKNPDAYVAVIGCYAQMGADALSEIEGVDLLGLIRADHRHGIANQVVCIAG